MSSSSTNDKKRKRGGWSGSKFPYKVDYNDHFETPKVAYEHLQPLIQTLFPKSQQPTLYDPYYCNGRTAVILKELGYTSIQHERRDFYQDISNGTVPNYDLLITNPPYSDQHKSQCFQYCFQRLRNDNLPFCILVPNYVASKEYFQQLLSSSQQQELVYLVPTSKYEYDHPEGTGKEVPPFQSIWYCGIGAANVQRIKEAFRAKKAQVTVASSLDELVSLKAIPTRRRPNPRQRRKMKKQQQQQQESASDGKKRAAELSSSNKPAKKKSRHRDETGKRAKKRF